MLQVSIQDVLDGSILEGQIRVHPLQLPVFGLALLHAPDLGNARARVLRQPVEIRRATDAVLAPQVRERDPRLAFLQDANDLPSVNRDFRMATSSRAPESPIFYGPASGKAYPTWSRTDKLVGLKWQGWLREI